MDNLVPIGRFSRMTRLSIKALRRYDEMGLLEPAMVDPTSGYRYYALQQANRAEAIRLLRSVDMPLEEIREMLEAADASITQKYLAKHRERLTDRLVEQQRMLAYLETLITRGEHVMPYEVTVKTAAPQPVLALRRHVSLETVGQEIQTGFGRLMGHLATAQLAPTAPPFIIMHDVVDQQTDGDIEMCFPVTGEVAGSDDIMFRTVDGGPVATTIHRGPYMEVGAAYHTLMGWIQDHGHEMTGPPRETYLNDPREVTEADQLTEVAWPIDAA